MGGLLSFIQAALPAAAAARGNYLIGQDQEQDKQRELAQQSLIMKMKQDMQDSEIAKNSADTGEAQSRTNLYKTQSENKWSPPFSTNEGLMRQNTVTGEIQPVTVGRPLSTKTPASPTSPTSPTTGANTSPDTSFTASPQSLIAVMRQQMKLPAIPSAAADTIPAATAKAPAAPTTPNAPGAASGAAPGTASSDGAPVTLRAAGKNPPTYQHIVAADGTVYLQNSQDPTDIRPATVNGKPLKAHVQADPRDTFTPVTVTNPDGSVVVKPFNTHSGTTGNAIGGAKPAAGAGGANDAKSKAYVSLMEQSLPTMEQLAGKVRPDRITAAMKSPNAGNLGLNQDEQTYLAAARNYLAGVLHQESGARLSKEQWDIGVQRFFPTVGDTPETIQAKLATARQLTNDRAKQFGGGAIAPLTPAGGDSSVNPFAQFIPKKPQDDE